MTTNLNHPHHFGQAQTSHERAVTLPVLANHFDCSEKVVPACHPKIIGRPFKICFNAKSKTQQMR